MTTRSRSNEVRECTGNFEFSPGVKTSVAVARRELDVPRSMRVHRCFIDGWCCIYAYTHGYTVYVRVYACTRGRARDGIYLSPCG